MTRTRLFHPLTLALLLLAPAMEARAQKSMGQTIPAPTESKPLAPWERLSIDEKPTTVQVRRSADSKPVPMVIVKRGNLAITEGDMVVGEHGKTLTGVISMENAIRNPQMKWPMVNGKVVVPYEVAAGVPRQQVQALQAAVAEFSQKTCIQFVPRTSKDRNYVSVFQGDGCYSYVGCVQQGKQELSLGQGCEFKGTAVHELMHALGFYHEQSRPDRDQYITVNFQNVESGLEDQFDVCQDCTTQDIPYEYDSIMHYGAQAFTKNGKATMVPKKAGAKVVEPYDKPGLTALDVKKIHKLYGCK
ncbi:M12 family metallopeptidase [Hyalangium versicolor]|uniref:M12 family metallopeptidase n=1 Tax=Hyalangium versicolor TaxID=2861190 RepID=UPI001CCDA30D|nr:M12 family metallopeptidase [Hyalangium versicolor]